MHRPTNAPNWLNSSLYPFQANYFNTPAGKLHYIDEGQGETLLFVHGTPTWSFLYRNYIKVLSKNYRCIAIDHIGFGLSDKPKDFDGTPQAHAANLERFINALGLEKFTLVVHDFGGTIGLPYAIKYPERVEKIVLFNTWLWATKEEEDAQKINKILHSGMGKFLYLNLNFSPRFLLKKAFYNVKKLSKAIHQHYRKPFPNKNSRYGLLKIGQELVGSSDWYEKQWRQIHKIKDKPVLMLWGMKDEFVNPTYLEKWKTVLTNVTVNTYEAGHFVQEEAFEESCAAITQFLKVEKAIPLSLAKMN